MKKTLREIRDFLNGLDEEQLDQVAMMMGSESAPGGPVTAYQLDEDYYWHEDGCFPKSALTEEDFQEYMENEEGRVVWKAGRVFFSMVEA